MRYICIHGHFYQPPRENAWLEHIDLQESAYPYHDWNERITAQCYAPNGKARILDSEGLITRIVNNYAKISFNFGPTLLSWLELHHPEVYHSILEADRESQKNFSGHGSAMAQSYNHIILPLATRRDKYTQILWGIRDFKKRFGRNPEGMWIPETAVDLETLDIMAEQGIRFTILAPHQASVVSRVGARLWTDVSRGRVDTTMPYQLNLPTGRKINIFFYDGGTAQSVAFGGLLTSGESFARRLVGGFSERTAHPQLVSIATDGETYGHHHRFGEMALAYAIEYVEMNKLATITNYGEYLEKHPPTHEVRINEDTSWSCVHGIGRWRSNCGCNAGRHPGWNQEWRAPLRQALDWLRDTVAPKYEEKTRPLLKEPWVARNDYLSVIQDRSAGNVEQFLTRHASRQLTESEKVTALKLLELQRYALLMYSSDGWFFDEISDIETMQIIQYAGRAMQLAQELFGDDTEASFLKLLEPAKSNIPEKGDGRKLYETQIKPSVVDLTKVAAHFAISSLFGDYGKQAKIYGYTIDIDDYQRGQCGNVRSAVGRLRVSSEITLEKGAFNFGAIHFGDQNVNAGVGEYHDEDAYQTLVKEVTYTCTRADFAGTVRTLDRHFGTCTFTLRSLFHDEQYNVVERVLGPTLAEAETAYRQIYERRYPLMLFLDELKYPLPQAFQSAAEVILNSDLTEAFTSETLDIERIQKLMTDVKTWRVKLDSEGLAYWLELTLGDLMAQLAAKPVDVSLLKSLVASIGMVRTLPFGVDLWNVQNRYYEMLQSEYPDFAARLQQGDETVREWLNQFVALGRGLTIRVPAVVASSETK
ncbi:MAG: DUF3536 domain-containing protein [Chloroflexi bacterium]|nr:DUF3536 domain-containing protein [Chloroflexota bacterium]